MQAAKRIRSISPEMGSESRGLGEPRRGHAIRRHHRPIGQVVSDKSFPNVSPDSSSSEV